MITNVIGIYSLGDVVNPMELIGELLQSRATSVTTVFLSFTLNIAFLLYINGQYEHMEEQLQHFFNVHMGT